MDRKQRSVSHQLALAVLLLGTATLLHAQVPVDEDGNPIGAYSEQSDSKGAYRYDDEVDHLGQSELQELVGPIALYPDDLLAIVLPASTYPLEIVQAARFLEQLENEPGIQPDEDWDESVVALLNYPEIVRMMDEDIDWTWRLGEAVLAQQEDVIAAVETFRDRAYAAGNLKSDDYQEVNYDDGVIEIVPVDDEIIYVPYYEPQEVVIRQPRRVYYYYPDPYPVYYYPYPAGYRFRAGYFWGVTTAFTIGWHNHYLRVHHPSYWGHPYYGRYYYGHYYRRPSINIYNRWYVTDNRRVSRHRYRDGDYWRPRRHAGSRQRTQIVNNYHYRDRDSRSVRRETVTRHNRRSNDGRMELNLRDRGSRATVTTRTRSTPSTHRDRGNVATRSNGTNRGVSQPNRTRVANRQTTVAPERRQATTTRRTTDRSIGRDTNATRGRSSQAERRSNTPVVRTPPRNTGNRAVTNRRTESAPARRSAPPRATGTRAPAPVTRQPSVQRSGSSERGASRGESRRSELRRSSSRSRRPND